MIMLGIKMVNVLTLDMQEVKASAASALANPAPLGLMGVGMTAILLCAMIAGILPSTSVGVVLAMAIFYGGFGMLITGLLEFRKGNTFNTLAFTSYGLFFLSLVAILVFPALGWAPAADGTSMAAYMLLWGLFTTYLFIGTLTTLRSLQLVFGSLAVLFFLLAIGYYTGSTFYMTLAGVEGIVCGLAAFYTAMALVLNGALGKALLPA